MSAGSGFYDDVASPQALAEWRKLASSNPSVLRRQQEILTTARVVHRFDMPYLAGYSRDGRTLYIDRHLPFVDKIAKRNVCVRDFLCIHESVEKALIDELHWKYERAHHVATAVEYENASSVVPIDAYRKFLRPFIKAADHEKLTSIPSDLDLTPMQSDKKLLSHLQSIMHGARAMFQRKKSS